MTTNAPLRIKTIAEFHAMRGLPRPKHPLISIINFDDVTMPAVKGQESLLFEFYTISLKWGMNHVYMYGQHEYAYDFNEGTMFFMAPNQILNIRIAEDSKRPTGWMMMVHPDYLYGTSLATAIKKYDFFDYSANEALLLSEDEEAKIKQIIQNISQEYMERIDTFSQPIIVSQLETLLNYSDRFYRRQFITRQKINHEILDRLNAIVNQMLGSDTLMLNGLPSVQHIADEMHVSPAYLRSILKQLTGQSTQQFIHEKLIEKAKEKLSTTNLSVSQIAYALGFEQPQSFSRLFKNKTNQSPLEFRERFN